MQGLYSPGSKAPLWSIHGFPVYIPRLLLQMSNVPAALSIQRPLCHVSGGQVPLLPVTHIPCPGQPWNMRLCILCCIQAEGPACHAGWPVCLVLAALTRLNKLKTSVHLGPHRDRSARYCCRYFDPDIISISLFLCDYC
jgi:hypothetical protein